MTNPFNKKLKKPLIGLAPMDGITDTAFRFITDKYGKPDILFTEFVSIDAIVHGATKVLTGFIHHKTKTATVAQLYGVDPKNFYKAAFVVCEMGFDGVDINMGCPDNSIVRRGGGAGLILKPKLAKEIILTVQEAVRNWSEGKSFQQVYLPDSIIDYIKQFKSKWQIKPERKLLPVSAKTRTGYDKIVTEDWIRSLLEARPAAISLHGRTLKQLYSGQADWEEIGKAAKLIKETKTLILGNGDIKSVEEAKQKCQQYGLDGVLIGRAALGNPWIFSEIIPTKEDRLKVAIEHCEAYVKMTPQPHFQSLRKHLGWYVKGLENSHSLRNELMKANNVEDVKRILIYHLVLSCHSHALLSFPRAKGSPLG